MSVLGIPNYPLRIWWGACKGLFRTMDQQNLGLIAAGIAFFGMLAIFPTVAAVIAVWGLIADPIVIDNQIELLAQLMPPEAFAILDDQVAQLIDARGNATLGWAFAVSTGAALWSSRAGVAALIRGMNAIYREDHREGLGRLVNAMIVTFSLLGVALVALVAVIVTPVILAFLPLGSWAELGLSVARWFVAIAVLVLGLGVVYRYGPNRRVARTPWVTPGAILAVLIWAAVSWLFSTYLENFGNYNEVYGSIGAVIALLMWLYIGAFVVLLGAALNAELELRTRRDTTVGPERPLGERGAYVADTYVKPR